MTMLTVLPATLPDRRQMGARATTTPLGAQRRFSKALARLLITTDSRAGYRQADDAAVRPLLVLCFTKASRATRELIRINAHLALTVTISAKGMSPKPQRSAQGSKRIHRANIRWRVYYHYGTRKMKKTGRPPDRIARHAQ